ncbi:hypothetical protein AGABI2DRAFT_120116 [Agaricus bisporus var. bisporus H97]|uniref:hypothetical protein n=1 Tax=Agaricus bisporus var. bisporus (strain H97 / ATCC MYA-4626 / FGSC 10389) TaxID=936046 RepID=UPI00029F7FC5|nr:hypothetical protein AGABI2DRAFT_120116 [Agaricus bisporus var. bisporus H97]EKV45152.1 hypothetical protein AGABI2DRAFT_120116 [Agaricus bisporus var. bisporus H97]
MVDVTSLPTLQGAKSTTFTRPPFNDSLTLAEIYAFHALNSSKHPVFTYAENSTKGTREICYSEAYAAIQRGHGMASRYHSDLVGDVTRAPVVGILASLDTITYTTFTVGIIHAGLTPFPISTRNSIVGVAHLIRTTGLHLLFVSPDSAMQRIALEATAILEKEGIIVKILPVPQFDDLYNEDDTFKQLVPVRISADPIILILHSSGSTAQPKPISMLNSNFVSWSRVPYYGEIDLAGLPIAAHSLPFFHAMGIGQISWSVGAGSVTACFKPTNPPTIPTPEVFLRELVQTKSKIVFCVPMFIEAWARSPENIPILRNLSAIVYGGAPMNRAVGDKLVTAGVNLIPFYGSTEAGSLSAVVPKSTTVEHWRYFKFSGHFKAHITSSHMVDGEEVGELVVLGDKNYNSHVLNTTVEGQRGYATSDLLARHPTEKDRYCVYGRVDDQLVLSTGEKTNPVPLENIFIQDKNIATAIMFGHGRFQNGVLVQPAEPFDPADETKFIAFKNLIWPTVEKVNDFAPAHSRIFKEMIITTNSNKPLEFTPKGTPRRQVCLKIYEKEIEAIYEAVKDSSQTDIPVPEVWTVENAMEFVDRTIKRVMKYPIAADQDIFLQGCDSLQTTWIRNSLLRAIRLSKNKANVHQIPPNFVYAHPSIQELGGYFWKVLTDNHDTSEESHATQIETRRLEMESLVTRYTAEISTPKWKTSLEPRREETILLTGSTGRLGCYVLKQLAENESIVKVYALNRASVLGLSAEYKQKEALKLWGTSLDSDALKKIVYLEYDPSKDKLGLTEDTYSKLQNSVTTIVYNGWRVDFNVGLGSFSYLIAGTRHLLDLAIGSSVCNGPKFVFISSISVFKNALSDRMAPESPVPASSAAGFGYAEGKWVAESVCQRISEATGLVSSIVRVGQLSGDSDGRWNVKEWVPALIKIGKAIGSLPSRDESVLWLPADAAAIAILDIVQHPNSPSSPVAYLNLVHPRSTPWDDLFGAAANYLQLDFISYDKWVELLGQKKMIFANGDHEASADLAGFLSGGQLGSGTFSMDDTLEICPSLRRVKALEGVDLIKSLGFWNF